VLCHMSARLDLVENGYEVRPLPLVRLAICFSVYEGVLLVLCVLLLVGRFVCTQLRPLSAASYFVLLRSHTYYALD
jgi:hypothetical protein